MRRPILLSAALLAIAAASASADETGGAPAPSGSSAVAGPPAAELVVAHGPAPVPAVTVRFLGQGAAVTARAVVLRAADGGVVARLPLGRVPLGRTIVLPRHALEHLGPGRYIVRVHAQDAWGRQLRRSARLPGKGVLVVDGSGPAVSGRTAGGTFPVGGPFTYGEPFGAPRVGYTHQGQDMAAAAGTPVVAPQRGRVTATGYQAAAAGEYVVMATATGESYFFAHCRRSSTAVTPGDPVEAGQRICRVGATGRATGPHLHFELWLGGWRAGPDSRPVDPRPQLEAWAG